MVLAKSHLPELMPCKQSQALQRTQPFQQTPLSSAPVPWGLINKGTCAQGQALPTSVCCELKPQCFCDRTSPSLPPNYAVTHIAPSLRKGPQERAYQMAGEILENSHLWIENPVSLCPA